MKSGTWTLDLDDASVVLLFPHSMHVYAYMYYSAHAIHSSFHLTTGSDVTRKRTSCDPFLNSAPIIAWPACDLQKAPRSLHSIMQSKLFQAEHFEL